MVRAEIPITVPIPVPIAAVERRVRARVGSSPGRAIVSVSAIPLRRLAADAGVGFGELDRPTPRRPAGRVGACPPAANLDSKSGISLSIARLEDRESSADPNAFVNALAPSRRGEHPDGVRPSVA